MGGTVYLDRKDAELRLDGGALAVYVNGERDGMVPLAPVDRVVVIGNQLVETSVLHRLAEQGVAVLFLSGRTQAFRGRLVGRLHNHARLRVAQYAEHRGPLALRLATEWITAKLAGQVAVLREAADARPDQRALLLRAAESIDETRAKAVEAGNVERLRGLEGGAAAVYFGALPAVFPPSLGFGGRERRPPRDPVNALLSLTYTLAHWEWVRECEAIGLDPLIGFYHELDYGRESLACDLMEPFRPMVDRWVWDLFRERRFERRDFASDQDRPGCSLKKGARSRFYAAYEDWIAPHRSPMRETVETLARHILNHGENALSQGNAGAAGQP
ncbi:MAG TPA: CRISPR-associated endonuclease Cas1 [Nitrospiraceae bacterium]|jgi:CRISPR-associated protein Cas1|nr:CRISPR-associated endonuclease Cas1 [Nitrospiraceae bacterium]